MMRGELQAIADLAVKHNLIVITDEIYAELTFEGEHVSIASLPGMRERTIFLHGFSKAYAMTGFRIGFACGPETLVGAMTAFTSTPCFAPASSARKPRWKRYAMARNRCWKCVRRTGNAATSWSKP